MDTPHSAIETTDVIEFFREETYSIARETLTRINDIMSTRDRYETVARPTSIRSTSTRRRGRPAGSKNKAKEDTFLGANQGAVAAGE